MFYYKPCIEVFFTFHYVPNFRLHSLLTNLNDWLLVLHRLQFLMLNFLRNSYGKSNNFAMNAIRRHLYVKYYRHKYQ